MTDEVGGSTALNGICAYFTMFPLDFPYRILSTYASQRDLVLDPFCGRGTTNYASRLLGLTSFGIDTSPVAVAIAQAKLANTSPKQIVRAAERILREVPEPREVPTGDFWSLAFHHDVLRTLCRLREGLLDDCRSDSRRALRAIILGALHGPRPKNHPSYFSNQCPRTYAPKPAYAVRYWRSRGLQPERVEVLEIIRARAERYYGQETTRGEGRVICGDSRKWEVYHRLALVRPVRWVITSPPFYGMRTYLQDQWLRYWFLGGPSAVDYSTRGQLAHSTPAVYAGELRQVWSNLSHVCSYDAQLVIRFGGIRGRKVDTLSIIQDSLANSGWKVTAIMPAGSASRGKRQALHFGRTSNSPLEEHDIWAVRTCTGSVGRALSASGSLCK